MSVMREKRSSPRKPVDLEVELVLPDGSRCGCRCTDIGIGGAFVEANPHVEIATKIAFVVSLPGAARPSTIEATVRWTTAHGMGLQFGLMGALETHALVTLLERAPTPREGLESAIASYPG